MSTTADLVIRFTRCEKCGKPIEYCKCEPVPDYNPNGTANPIGDAAYWRARAERAEAALASQMDADTALLNVLEERKRQEAKWGEQNHDPYTYLTILMEEVGEYAQACLQTQFGGKHGGLDHMREEAIQTAAVALAIVECLERGKWQWPHGDEGR